MYEQGNYQLLYYKQLQDKRGDYIRLEIYFRYEQGAIPLLPIEIGDLQSMALEVQGTQGDVFQPVVKTSLRFSIVDTWDVEDEYDGSGHVTVKHGNWEEFFTPDSTLYLVRVKQSMTGSSWITRWSGYITPDSWRESLDYHGVITITARDNIGKLNDIPLDIEADARGMYEIGDFIEAALRKINLPMDYMINDAFDNSEEHYERPAKGIQFNTDDSILGALFLVKHFKGKTYYPALTEILDSIGYTLRWGDFNTVVLAPIRNIPMYDNNAIDDTSEADIIFFNGDGSKDPAYRSIVEEVKYESQSTGIDVMRGLAFTGNRRGYQLREYPEGEGHDYQNGGASDGYGWQPGWGFLDGSDCVLSPELEEIDGSATKDYAILCANDIDIMVVNAPVFKIPVVNTNGTLKIEFAFPLSGDDRGEDDITEGQPVLSAANNTLSNMRIDIAYTVGSSTLHWDGEKWGTGIVVVQPAAVGPYTLEVPIAGSDLGNGGDLTIKFIDIIYAGTPGKEGIYARIQSIVFEDNGGRLVSNKVTTINDERYNVLATRKPGLAPLSQEVSMILPEQYSNALYYYKNGVVAQLPYLAHWNDSTKEYPFPALVHMQMLCFHHLPMSVLEGDCTLEERRQQVYLDMIYRYKGKKYILQSCTYDFATCTMRGAILREYIFYDDLYVSTWTAVLVSAGSNKLAVTRALSDVLGISLRDAKAIVDAAPTNIVVETSRQQCETIKAAVEAAGGTARIYEE